MVATTTGNERTACTSPKKVRWLYYLSVVVPHAGYGGDEEDGGDDDGTR